MRKNENPNMKNQNRVCRLGDLGTIFLCDCYDRLDSKPFRDAISDYAGLAELLTGNNAPEARAIKRMVAAESELNQIRAKVRRM